MKNIPEESLIRLVSNVLGVPAEAIAGKSAFADFSNWDSMAYISLILALEAEIGVKFSHTDVLEVDSIEGLRAVLRKNGVEIVQVAPGLSRRLRQPE
jgi:acyl carrier protein